MAVVKEQESLFLMVTKAIQKRKGFASLGATAFGSWFRRWFRCDLIPLPQAFLLTGGDRGDLIGGDILILIVVPALEFKAIVKNDLHPFSPVRLVAQGNAVEFADMVFVAEAV